MTKRMVGLLLCLLVIALLLVFDAPRSDALAEPSAGPARQLPPTPVPEPVSAAVDATANVATEADGSDAAKVAEAPGAGKADEAIADLFGAVHAPPASAPPPDTGGDDARTAVPYTLLGFKEEGGARDAYLLHDGAVLMTRAGVVLERRYRVLSLLQDAVLMQDQQTGEKIRIGFGDKQ